MSSSSAASTDLHALQTCGDDVIRTVNLLCSEAPRHDACGELGHELHELSLSTGTMDRQMFHFVCDVLLDGTAIDPRRATDSSLRNALGLATRTPYVKRTSLLRGGVASFYFLTSLVLREARVAIRRASKIDTGNYMGRRMLSGSAVAFALLQAGKRLLRYGRLPRALPTLYSAVYAGLLSWFAITYYQMRRPLNKLKQCNKRLLHMLRMWSILQSVVAQASLRRAVSYVELDSIGRSQSSGQGSAAHRTGGGGRGIAAKSFLRYAGVRYDGCFYRWRRLASSLFAFCFLCLRLTRLLHSSPAYWYILYRTVHHRTRNAQPRGPAQPRGQTPAPRSKHVQRPAQLCAAPRFGRLLVRRRWARVPIRHQTRAKRALRLLPIRSRRDRTEVVLSSGIRSPAYGTPVLRVPTPHCGIPGAQFHCGRKRADDPGGVESDDEQGGGAHCSGAACQMEAARV